MHKLAVLESPIYLLHAGYGGETAKCFMYLSSRNRWGVEAKGSFRCTVTQVYSEKMFQDNLRLYVFVIMDTAIPKSLLF